MMMLLMTEMKILNQMTMKNLKRRNRNPRTRKQKQTPKLERNAKLLRTTLLGLQLHLPNPRKSRLLPQLAQMVCFRSTSFLTVFLLALFLVLSFHLFSSVPLFFFFSDLLLAKSTVLNYMRTANRPYSDKNVFDNLHGVLSKKLVRSIASLSRFRIV